eukprot:403335503
MRILTCSLLLTAVAFADPQCRFAGSYSQSDIVQNTQVREEFLQKVIQQEAKFIKEIGYDQRTGLTLDGQQIDSKTGMPIESPDRYTSATSEAIHIALLAKVLNGDPSTNLIYTKEEALEILRKKIQSLEQVQNQYPSSPSMININTQSKFIDRQNGVSQNENAKLFWASYGLLEVLEGTYSDEVELIQRWKSFLDTLIENSVLNTQENTQNDQKSSDLYDNMMYLFTDLSDSEILKTKSSQTNTLIDTDKEFLKNGHFDLLFLPYHDNKEYIRNYEDHLKSRIQEINERQLPGLTAYANQELINPSFTTGLFLVNKPVATAWYHNFLSGPAAQTQYGSVDFMHISGSEVSKTLSWESKITPVLGMMGGLSEIVKKRMIRDQIYHKFIQYSNNNLLKHQEDFTSCRLRDFPQDFAFGSATAAFQIEGASTTNGRGPSIWDDLCAIKGRIKDGDDGTVADDFYHKYEQDIKMISDLGIKNFRMSLSWSRILPKGTVDQVNQEGVDFYNAVFDALIAHGITPWVTLYHWDLPSALQDKTDTGSWLGTKIIGQFNDYADFCFKTFGSKVKKWLTFNEPWTFTWDGYGHGSYAPGRCTNGLYRDDCDTVGGGGNSSTEPYIASHTVILAHGTAVKTYRDKYQKQQQGQIGWTLNSNFAYPFNASEPDDVEAVDVITTFMFGWYMDPVVYGKYPDVMIEAVGDRLPKFTDEQVELIKGSYDFIGLNHYTSNYVRRDKTIKTTDWGSDSQCIQSPTNATGHVIGPRAENSWLYIVPNGIRDQLNWINNRYPKVTEKLGIIIFENGASVQNESAMALVDAVHDTFRLNSHKGYISNVKDAITLDGVNVKGFFIWSLLDNFEWSDGYWIRMGQVYVDYKDNQKRYIKDSAFWYSQFVRTHDINCEFHNPHYEMLKKQEMAKQEKFLISLD